MPSHKYHQQHDVFLLVLLACSVTTQPRWTSGAQERNIGVGGYLGPLKPRTILWVSLPTCADCNAFYYNGEVHTFSLSIRIHAEC